MLMKRTPMGQKYKIGKISSKNTAVGDRAKAEHTSYANPKNTEMQMQALDQIRQLIELMATHSEEIDSPDTALAYAESIEDALNEESPSRSRIEKLIGNIAPAVGGVTALAKAIDAIHATVSHL